MTANALRKAAAIMACAVMASAPLFVATPARAAACEERAYDYCVEYWEEDYESYFACHETEIRLCPPPKDQEYQSN